MAIILGIDPGSRITGYGVIQSEKQNVRYITSGCIRITGATLPEKLHQVFAGIQEIITAFKPDQGAIEQVFMHENAGSALKLGQARGAAIVSMANNGLSVAEYSARQIKQAVVGYGAAKKEQVQHMVQQLLLLSGQPQVDAADGLAVAICHARAQLGEQWGGHTRMKGGRVL